MMYFWHGSETLSRWLFDPRADDADRSDMEFHVYNRTIEAHVNADFVCQFSNHTGVNVDSWNEGPSTYWSSRRVWR